MPSGHDLPDWVVWEERAFPDANLLLLRAPEPTLVDSGFVGHAEDTAGWAESRGGVVRVVNTHWHSDHVGGNALLSDRGAEIAASALDASAINSRHAGCCSARRLDQPVAPYRVDVSLTGGDVLPLGSAEWEVIATPGHTLGHLSLWQPDERLLVTGDALSDYDVGWVDLSLDGPDAAATAVASLQRLSDLQPRVLLTAHGRVPEDTGAALAAAHRRAERLVEDRAGAVWYGVRRVFAYALMIRGGILVQSVEAYLNEREWLHDAAASLSVSPDELADDLVRSMRGAGAVVTRDGRLCAAAPHTRVERTTLDQPWPDAWPG